jgi:aconitate hydratase
MIANMSPENGATVSFFPVDHQTLEYLYLTGRPTEQIDLVTAYCKAQKLFRENTSPDPVFSEVFELDLAQEVEPSLAGPRRPQDRLALAELPGSFLRTVTLPAKEKGFALQPADIGRKSEIRMNGKPLNIGHGAVVIAAITSCTNTSNPFVMVGAGLLAKKALERGLGANPYVKASLAPGSRVVAQYLEKSGLMESLSELGFNLVGFGCATCIGNSGPLASEVSQIIRSKDIIAAAVISGNRNFEGRIHPDARLTYLASPPLVVAYALAGTVNIDIAAEPLGTDRNGAQVFLKDIWPSNSEIQEVIEHGISRAMFIKSYENIFSGCAAWDELPAPSDALYPWRDDSTYIQEPPFFTKIPGQSEPLEDILGARPLAVFGDSVTTDHISPAGNISACSEAGKYLQNLGVDPSQFNSYGARRGNYQVMMRGTFANIRLKNLLLPGVEGGETLHLPDNIRMSIFEAAEKYQTEGVPLIILAGSEYGTGSSRDWAAKGVLLLGVRAVLAESFERIHRSNLVGMGILPLQFNPGENVQSLGLSGFEIYDIIGMRSGAILPQDRLQIHAHQENGKRIDFQVTARLDTSSEVEHIRGGGLLNSLLKKYQHALK